MLSALENSVAALEDQVGADRILCLIQALVEALLLGEEHDCAMVLLQTSFYASLIDCLLNVTPDIRCVVSVEVDNRFWCRVKLLTNSSTLNNILTVVFY